MAKKPASKKGKKPKPLAQRLAGNPALQRKYQRDPGLRHKYLTGALEKYLTPAQRKSRTLNTRLNTPIAPGSSTTERDLAHEAQAAQTVRYGPQDRAIAQQLGVARQVERDTGSLYDQYRQALQEHAAAVQAFQAGAQQALGATAAGITGLGQQQAAQMQAQADAGAAQQGVAQAGQIGDLANQALAVRQGVMGTFQGEQALQGAAANRYANAQANVVAPGQKLGALAQARGRTGDIRQKQADLATEEGAFNQQFRSERRQDEFKNQLAMQTLGANIANQQADNAIAATTAATRAQQSSPEGVAATSSARANASTAAKYGYTAHQWAMLGPTRRAEIIKAAKPKAGGAADTVYTSGAFAGRKKSDIAAMSDAERQKIVRDYNAGKGPGAKGPKPKTESAQYKADFRHKYGVDPLPTASHNTFKSQVSQAQRAFNLVGTKDKKGRPITTDAVVGAMTSGGTQGIPKLPAVVIRAALELKRYGHITPGTANRLHHAGYSVATLGYKTSRSTRRPARPGSRNPSGPTRGPGASVPGIGGGA